MINKIRFFSVLLIGPLLGTFVHAEDSSEPQDSVAQERFTELAESIEWQEVFSDRGTDDWQKYWFLDGEKATVVNTEEGMEFSAGPEEWDPENHAVLWTKESFSGDIRIEYDYTRLDNVNKWVNILYIQATGIGVPPYSNDIVDWSHLRIPPTMESYFKNMHLLHISYSAFGKEDMGYSEDYVRARRYPVSPTGTFRTDTDIAPDYFRTGLFKLGETYHVTVLKTDGELFFQLKNAEVSRLFSWNLSSFPAITEGRIGLRHMWLRSSRYKNFKVFTHHIPGSE